MKVFLVVKYNGVDGDYEVLFAYLDRAMARAHAVKLQKTSEAPVSEYRYGIVERQI